MCNNCIHKAVCSIYTATGGYVRECKHFREVTKKVTGQRLIDADALMEKLSRMIGYCKTDNKVNGLTALFRVGDAVMDCPTVDAVPVVRCRDCKYKFTANGHDKKGCPLDGVGLMNEDDFCSCGERRTE